MKRAILLVSDTFLIGFMKYIKDPNILRSWKVSKNVIPDDAVPIRAFQTDINGMLGVVLESELFEDIEDGKTYPTLPCPVFSGKLEGEGISDYEP